MRPYELWKALAPLMMADEMYRSISADIEKYQPYYDAILEKLTPQEQDWLEHYVAACESVKDPVIHLAYQLGCSGK